MWIKVENVERENRSKNIYKKLLNAQRTKREYGGKKHTYTTKTQNTCIYK